MIMWHACYPPAGYAGKLIDWVTRSKMRTADLLHKVKIHPDCTTVKLYDAIYDDKNDETFDPMLIQMECEMALAWDTWEERDEDQSKYSGPRCECGAAHSSFPQFHSDWCPLNRR